MTDPDAPHDEPDAPENARLGYYAPPSEGSQPPPDARPYRYVPAATGTMARPYPTPAYAAPPREPAPPHLPPAYAVPGTPRDHRPRGVAVTGLVLAIVGLILALVPATAGFAIVIMLVAFVVSIIGLAGSRHGGKGFAGTGLALSVLGGLVAVVVTVLQVLGAFGSSSSYDPPGSYGEYEPYEETVDGGVAAPGTDGIPDDGVVLATPVPLTVAETAFGPEPGGTGIWVVVILDNTNADYVYDDAEVQVRAVDAGGAPVATAFEYVTALQGRSAVVLHGVATGQTPVAAIEVTVPDAAAATVSPGLETGSFTVTGVQQQADGDGTRVSGQVAGRFASDQWYARTAVVARGVGGPIVGGQIAYLDTVPGDGTPTTFWAWFSPPLPADVVIETYPSP